MTHSADIYDSTGKLPFTLLVGHNGKVLKSRDGYPDEMPEQFTAKIEQIKKRGLK